MGWLIAILAGGLLTFNAVVTPDKAASEAEKALKKQFPNAQVQVNIEGKRGKDVLNGRFRRVDIELTNLSLSEMPLGMGASAQTAPAITPPTAATATAPIVARDPDGAIQAGAPRPPSAPQWKSVEIKTPKPEKIKVGRAGELNLGVRDFKWQNLSVERAQFQFADVEYDFGALKSRSELKLIRVGASKMHLELAPDALTPFISKRVENITNPKIVLTDGLMTIKGARNFYGVSAPFEVNGQPSFSGAQMVLKSPKLLVSGFNVPAMVSAPILNSVNPLYSFDKIEGLPFEITLTKVESRDGKLQIDGDLTMKP